MAGLFQPDTVGGFNASAARGCYKDQHAVSVGMGHRFPHRLTAKADAAFNDNALEYSVGINYEFNGAPPPAISAPAMNWKSGHKSAIPDNQSDAGDPF
ncbi:MULTISPECIES: YadA C-terminal domain-containing protein [Edwardsiella]|uniref:YadA-like family protein n=1 Tax=Edwardsiella anguillarum TaxID=1821960 RepID=A0ABY8SJF6_9GAMM|nr:MULTISPECIES: YadA C-terminal domain-containing protein [Edwardsiella]UBU95053.1 YadA-like family protein [Edwardsiella sp. LADL05-105]UOU80892.1 YadA-like family protein [Edwardsiella anguillarum]WHP82060.1 YadA-like family protein [Edwardsiella anguillarum]WHP85784.1 YadA-like family protein [Edwardsiella anguillarum]WHP89572.1 YadA-like family protein [Edwardsiella anguillarum]